MDLARTLCGLCGIEPASTFQGRALFSNEAPPEAMFATIGFGERESRALPNQVVGTWSDGGGWPRRACIRTSRYRLDMTVRRNGARVGPQEEDAFLADRALDPLETANRAADPHYVEALATLRAALWAHVESGLEVARVPTYSEAERGIN